jgi:hypothetical protein
MSNSTKIAEVASKDVANIDDPHSPFEKQDKAYYFVGARFRYVIVPKFYMNIFGDGGATVGVPAFGPEFTVRKNGFEYVISAMYASYAMDPTPFKAKTDDNDAWEIVDTNLKTLYLMSDFPLVERSEPQIRRRLRRWLRLGRRARRRHPSPAGVSRRGPEQPRQLQAVHEPRGA